MSDQWWASLPNETLIESAWERQMNLAGIDAYERSRLTAGGELKAASESTAGQRLMRKCIDRATDAIAQMQKDQIDLRRVDRGLKATTLLVPADTCAMLTLKILFDKTYACRDLDNGVKYQDVVKQVAKAIELELNFRNWVSRSKEAAVAYAKAHGTKASTSLAERLIAEHGSGERQIRKWKQTFEDLNRYKWSDLEEHYCGEAMVLTVCQALPDAFDIHLVTPGAFTEKFVRMVPAFRERFTEIETKVAQLQVVKKPMLTRPKPWRKE